MWKCIHKVIDAINTKLMSSWITMPGNDECHEIAAAFERKTHIPQLIGAIDGTHIPILPPSDEYRDYINRKGWPSMILQVVVDNNYRCASISFVYFTIFVFNRIIYLRYYFSGFVIFIVVHRDHVMMLRFFRLKNCTGTLIY